MRIYRDHIKLYGGILMRKVGLSRNELISERDFAEMKDAGIDCIELSPIQSDNYDYVDYDRLGALSAKYGIELRSYHLRFAPFEMLDISSLDEELRRKSVLYHNNCMTCAANAGMKIFVIHPSGEPNEPETRSAKLAASKRSLSELADHAEKLGGVIAVEDLPRTCLGNTADEMLELIRDDNRLRVCFDTNHLLKEDPSDFARKVADRIVTTHVSDYDFKNERHWLPGEGKVDWVRLMDALDEIGYAGPLVYELGFKAPIQTLTRPRDLTSADFVKNRNELEARKTLTVIGTPREDL